MKNVENMKLQVLGLYEELENEFNNPNFSHEVAEKIQSEIAELNKEINETLFPTSKSEIEVIAEQLLTQGFYSVQEEGTLTVTGMSHDLSIVKLDNGFALETFRNHSITHFQTNEWANYKEVKTLKGLNGYLRKFGFGQVSL